MNQEIFSLTNNQGDNILLANYNVVIEQIILVYARKFKPMVVKPFKLEAQQSTVNKLVNTVGKALETASPASLKIGLERLVPEVVDFNQTPISKSIIVNDWNTERFKVLIKIRFDSKTSNDSSLFLIQGYTDYFGYTKTRTGKALIDENNLNIYINSVTEFRKFGIKERTPDGREYIRYHWELIDTYNVYHNDQKPRDYVNREPRANKLFLPSNVITVASTPVNINNFYTNTDLDVDTNLVSKKYNNPIDHLHTILGSIVDSAVSLSADDELAYSMDPAREILNASLNLQTFSGEVISSSMFMSWLGNKMGIRQVVKSFPLKILIEHLAKEQKVNPSNVITVIDNAKLREVELTMSRSSEFYKTSLGSNILDTTEDLSLGEINTLHGNMFLLVHETISYLMGKYGIINLGLTATNVTSLGEQGFFTALTSFGTIMDNVGDIRLLETIKNRFLKEFENKAWYKLLKYLELLGNRKLKLYVEASFMSEMVIVLELDDALLKVRIPTFAEASFSPIVTTDQMLKNNLADYKGLLDIVTDEIKHKIENKLNMFPSHATPDDSLISPDDIVW